MFKAYNRRTKRCLLCEEYVSLTKDLKAALLLNQCVYWMERTHDYDLFLKEEYEHNPHCNVSYRHGWFYKSYEAFNDECMLESSKSTISRILNSFIENEWLERRHRKSTNLDQTYEYRVNLMKLQSDLLGLGYTLANYKIDLFLSKSEKKNKQVLALNPEAVLGIPDLLAPKQYPSHIGTESPMFQNKTCKLQDETSVKQSFIEASDFFHKSSMFSGETPMLQDEICKFQNETSATQQNMAINKEIPHKIPMFQKESSMLQNETSMFQNETPYIDTKITNTEITKTSLSPTSLSKPSNSIPLDTSKKEREEIGVKMIKMFSRNVSQGQELIPHYERINRLKYVLHTQLQGKLEHWEKVCQNITRSKFLMGEAQTSDFKATLDWVITKDHAIKIFEGSSYGIGDRVDGEVQTTLSEEAQEALILEFKNSNKHPLWIKAGLILEQKLEFYTFKIYICELDVLMVEHDHIKLFSHDAFTAAWVKKNLEGVIKKTLSMLLNRQIEYLTISTEPYCGQTAEINLKPDLPNPRGALLSEAIEREKIEEQQIIHSSQEEAKALISHVSQSLKAVTNPSFEISKSLHKIPYPQGITTQEQLSGSSDDLRSINLNIT